jgi:hypothetical protein
MCDKLREELEERDLTRYVQPTLTAHVVKSPPDHEAALALLLRLRGMLLSAIYNRVKYSCQRRARAGSGRGCRQVCHIPRGCR